MTNGGDFMPTGYPLRAGAGIAGVVIFAILFAAAATLCLTSVNGIIRLVTIGVLALQMAGLIILALRNASAAVAIKSLITSIVAEAADLEAIAKAQENLEANLTALRDLCYQHGDPIMIEGRLCFGEYAAKDTTEIVDQIQRLHGGAATIFQGGTRVSTNIKDQSGTRLVGTTLDKGAAFDKLFGQGSTYRGEAKIAGVDYITIYEPIICSSQVVGAIFVAVTKADSLAAQGSTAERQNVWSEIRATALRLQRIVRDRDVAMRAANEHRSDMADTRRKQKAMERATALAQENVVSALSVALDRLASADLTSAIEGAFPAEYQKVKQDFGSATEALRRALRAINSETRAIRAGSIQITSAIDELSHRTEQQAASLEETAASLDQITEAVRETAKGVDKAHQVAAETRLATESSSDVMNEAVAAMGEIDRSSKQIGQIIAVINEISFQTNLLALNAGVEAARAGEGGRGFAVVAAEVRALAQRSAEAALEIKALIEASAQHVDRGVNLIAATGSALHAISVKVANIGDIITTIAAGAKGQALSLQEINTAVTQMDKFTQQNAAMVEESTAASHVLSQQAATLESLVAQFRTGDAVVDFSSERAQRFGRSSSNAGRVDVA